MIVSFPCVRVFAGECFFCKYKVAGSCLAIVYVYLYPFSVLFFISDKNRMELLPALLLFVSLPPCYRPFGISRKGFRHLSKEFSASVKKRTGRRESDKSLVIHL